MVHLTLHKGDNINLTLYNCSDKEIGTIARGFFTAGNYLFPLPYIHKASGIYIISLKSSSQKMQRKAVKIHP